MMVKQELPFLKELLLFHYYLSLDYEHKYYYKYNPKFK